MNLISNPNYLHTHYDPLTGLFYRTEPDGTGLRQVFPADQRRISARLASTGKYTFKGLGSLAWEFIHGSCIPEGYLVYYKNLDKDDVSASNLGIISKEDNKRVNDAIANLEGSLKIVPDEREVYTYKVKYKEDGKFKIKAFQDCIAAKAFHKEIMNRSVRLLGKYAVSQ